MSKRKLPLSRAYTLIEPGPIVLLTTGYKGLANIMTLSWHTMMEFEPPLIGCIIGNCFSSTVLRATRQCALNIPTAELARQVVRCGNTSGRDRDKFADTGLTPVPASQVEAPLIAECYANLECRVFDTRMVNRYGLFVLEVVQAWIDPGIKNPQTLHHCGRGAFRLSGQQIKLPSRMK